MAAESGLTAATLYGSADRNHYIIETTGVGLAIVDYDNDGHTDLLLTRWGTNVLYKNHRGKFRDVTHDAGLPTQGNRWGTGCSFLDYDRDGDLDLFVANYVELDLAGTPGRGGAATCFWKDLPVFCGPRSLPKALNALYRNNGDGTFSDISRTAGILTPGPRYALGVSVADFNRDGWPDIYVACDQTASLLYENTGHGGFAEQAGSAGAAYNFDGQTQAGMGVAIADYDGNGWPDIVKTNFQDDLPSLFFNEDGRFFTDYAQQAGLGSRRLLGWGVAFLDADEDGWPDVIMAHGHIYPEVAGAGLGETYPQQTLLFRNQGDARFRDVTSSAGPAFVRPRAARGLAVGDLDGDGRPEVVIANLNSPPSVLRNRAPGANRAVIRLHGVRSNRGAVGASATVRNGGRVQTLTVQSGASYLSQHDFGLYFGLGEAETLDEVNVRWPSGESQTWLKLPANRTIRLTEGSAKWLATPFGATASGE